MGLRVKILPSHKSRSSRDVLNMGYVHFLVVPGLWLPLWLAGGLDWTWAGCRAWPRPFQVLIPSPLFIINSCVTLGDANLFSGSRRSPGGGHGNHSSILVWRVPQTEEPGGLQSMVSQRIGHN